jgi:His-Xaa-Ser system protein HxsD
MTAKGLTLKIDTSVYPLEAVQAAAYTFTDRAHVRITRNGGGKEVSLSLKPKSNATDLAAIADELHNEFLHETLRRRISEANQKIREFIVTKALVSAQVPSAPPDTTVPAPQETCPECEAEARAAGNAEKSSAPQPAAPVDAELEKEIEKLLGEIEKSGPGRDDPLGVAVPWEKKFGAQAAKTRPAAAQKGKPALKKKAAKPAAAPKQKGKTTR